MITLLHNLRIIVLFLVFVFVSLLCHQLYPICLTVHHGFSSMAAAFNSVC